MKRYFSAAYRSTKSIAKSIASGLLLVAFFVLSIALGFHVYAQDAAAPADSAPAPAADAGSASADQSSGANGDTSSGSAAPASSDVGSSDASGGSSAPSDTGASQQQTDASNEQSAPADQSSNGSSAFQNTSVEPVISSDFANDVSAAQSAADTEAQLKILPAEYQSAGDVTVASDGNSVVIDQTPVVDTPQEAQALSAGASLDQAPIDASVVNDLSNANNLSSGDVQTIDQQTAQNQDTTPAASPDTSDANPGSTGAPDNSGASSQPTDSTSNTPSDQSASGQSTTDTTAAPGASSDAGSSGAASGQ